MLIDTHCHLDFPEFDRDLDEVIRRAKNEGIGYIVNIGSSLQASKRSQELAAKYSFIYASCGIHPHEADKFNPDTEKELYALAKKEKVAAVGETGLDYYKNYSNPDNQRALFISLIKLAKDLNLPLIIHSRQAQGDTLGILKKYFPIKAVLHCFSGGVDFLNSCLDLGFFVSFTCNVTYKKAQNLRELVRLTPLERLLLETDAPFLPPEGFRGKRNEPAYVKVLAEEISRLKAIPLDEISRITTDNARSFFNLH